MHTVILPQITERISCIEDGFIHDHFMMSNIDAFGEKKKAKERGKGKYCMSNVNKTLSDNRATQWNIRAYQKKSLSDIQITFIL